MWEIKSTLNTKKDSAVGLDNISYSMIKNTPFSALEQLTNLFNSLKSNNIPHQWKQILVHPVPKVKKEHHNPANYRAIVLESCIGKILQNIVKNRIEWILENSRVLPSLQFGFRRGKSCTDCLSYITTYIRLGYSKNSYTVGFFWISKQRTIM